MRVNGSSGAAFVEEMSLLMQASGFPRMAGRILGWLLICSPEHQSAAELGEALHASKGSISTMTRLLMNMGLVERVGIPGRREAFFRMKPGVWGALFNDQLGKTAAARRLAAEGLELLADEPEEARRRLQDLHDLHAFMEEEFPALIARWEERRRAGLEAAAIGA
jgi:DNA-binding transcriptional regulator GbsR (MarR family)